jgi:hypothetical protein
MNGLTDTLTDTSGLIEDPENEQPEDEEFDLGEALAGLEERRALIETIEF